MSVWIIEKNVYMVVLVTDIHPMGHLAQCLTHSWLVTMSYYCLMSVLTAGISCHLQIVCVWVWVCCWLWFKFCLHVYATCVYKTNNWLCWPWSLVYPQTSTRSLTFILQNRSAWEIGTSGRERCERGCRRVNMVPILCTHLCKGELVECVPGLGVGYKWERWRGWIQLWYIVRNFVNVTIYPIIMIINKRNQWMWTAVLEKRNTFTSMAAFMYISP
jgi:hypothetical protein